VEALKPIRQLLTALKAGPGLEVIELADAVSGGHIKAATKTSTEHFADALDTDTREAALMGLDLARLNEARFRVVLEILEKIIDVQDSLADRWEKYPVEQRPELRDLQAGAALVAGGYARQQSHQRRQIIIDALRGSFCPEPYLWGFQDELLRGLIESGLTLADFEFLNRLSPSQDLTLSIEEVIHSDAMDTYEKLASVDFATILAAGNLVRSRYEAAGLSTVQVRRSPKGTKLIEMIEAGRGLTKKKLS
jgi:hypothetical protein